MQDVSKPLGLVGRQPFAYDVRSPATKGVDMSNRHLPDWDWRIWGGSLITIIWLAGGAIYLGAVVGWAFWHEGADTIGGFFEGFFAPLAFLWLVVGLFIQQKELSRTREEMRQSNLLSAQQAKAMEASALTARQQAFFLIADNVRRQTGNLLGVMLASSGNDLIGDEEEIQRHWIAHSAGDFERFPRLLVAEGNALLEGNFGQIRTGGEFFFGSPFRASMSEEYIRSFRRLLQLARDCDTGSAIRGTVAHTPHGLVYGAMLSHLDAPRAWALLDGPEPKEPTADVAGTWPVVLDPEIRDASPTPEFTLRLRVSDDGVVTGATESSDGEAMIEAGAIVGNALFFRQHVNGPVLFWATVDGNRMQGRGENHYGDTFGFSATRCDEP